MQYRKLGTTDLEVSEICLGTMTWGEQNTESEAHEQLDYALSCGVNFVDTAEMYPVPPKDNTQGRTEQFIGSWLQKGGRRQDIVLATKAAGPADWLPHLRGGPRLNRSHLEEALNNSLQRLNTDYVDLYQLHWPERNTNYFGKLGYEHKPESDAVPLEETLAAIKELIDAGKIRHYGLSNETPWGLMRTVQLAESISMPAPVSIQNPYNLLNRSFEVGLAECSHREKVGLLAYSPLAFGVLSGKYLGGCRPDNARLTLFDRFTRYTHPYATEAVQAYAELAREFGVSLSHLALSFVTTRAFVTSNIIGATTMAQLAENIDSLAVVLSKDLLKALDDLHGRYTIPCP